MWNLKINLYIIWMKENIGKINLSKLIKAKQISEVNIQHVTITSFVEQITIFT